MRRSTRTSCGGPRRRGAGCSGKHGSTEACPGAPRGSFGTDDGKKRRPGSPDGDNLRGGRASESEKKSTGASRLGLPGPTHLAGFLRRARRITPALWHGSWRSSPPSR